MKALLCLLIVLGASCSKYKSKQFSSGTPSDTPNDRDLVTLNWRIKDTAIAQHSLALLNQLKDLKFEQVPAAWPMVELEELVSQLKYLHKQSADNYEKVILKKGRPFSTLTYYTVSHEKRVLKLNSAVTQLSWSTSSGLKVVLLKTDKNWIVSSEFESLTLTPSLKRLCYLDSCIDL